jgi:hypothetical protein
MQLPFAFCSALTSVMCFLRAFIAHEDKPGVFKFVWYSARQLRHQSFICLNNGFFFDGKARLCQLFWAVLILRAKL